MTWKNSSTCVSPFPPITSVLCRLAVSGVMLTISSSRRRNRSKRCSRRTYEAGAVAHYHISPVPRMMPLAQQRYETDPISTRIFAPRSTVVPCPVSSGEPNVKHPIYKLRMESDAYTIPLTPDKAGRGLQEEVIVGPGSNATGWTNEERPSVEMLRRRDWGGPLIDTATAFWVYRRGSARDCRKMSLSYDMKRKEGRGMLGNGCSPYDRGSRLSTR